MKDIGINTIQTLGGPQSLLTFRVLLHFGFEKKNKSGDDQFDIFISHWGVGPSGPL